MNLNKLVSLMCAMRYALGRKTYVVECVTGELIENWDEFGDGDKKTMIAEIEDALSEDKAGMDCDRKNWMEVLSNDAKQEVSEDA